MIEDDLLSGLSVVPHVYGRGSVFASCSSLGCNLGLVERSCAIFSPHPLSITSNWFRLWTVRFWHLFRCFRFALLEWHLSPALWLFSLSWDKTRKPSKIKTKQCSTLIGEKDKTKQLKENQAAWFLCMFWPIRIFLMKWEALAASRVVFWETFATDVQTKRPRAVLVTWPDAERPN